MNKYIFSFVQWQNSQHISLITINHIGNVLSERGSPFICCVYAELFISSISKIFSARFLLFKFTNIQFINISISSFSAKIYILYIRIKKTLTQELAYEMSEGIVTADFFSPFYRNVLLFS